LAQEGELEALARRGEKGAWEAFVAALCGPRRRGPCAGIARAKTTEVEDLVQEVFLRLCRDDFSTSAQLRPDAGAALDLGHDHCPQHRTGCAAPGNRPVVVPIEAVPEGQPRGRPGRAGFARLKLPEALLSPRQRENFDDVVRSRDGGRRGRPQRWASTDRQCAGAHHKAMVKLRAHFKGGSENRKAVKLWGWQRCGERR